MTMQFKVGGRRVDAAVDNLIIAGWTGRNRAAVDHHIQELAELGVKPPRSVPMFYRVGASLLTTSPEIGAVGSDSSGEVEFVLLSLPEGEFVGVGSDHTDRRVEAYGVTVSKQVCPKPIATELWPLAQVEPHWDQLVLRSWVTRDGKRTLYQEGKVDGMHSPAAIRSKLIDAGGAMPAGTAMFCGTLPVIGGIAGGDLFEIELHDPVLGRSIRHAYTVQALAIVD